MIGWILSLLPIQEEVDRRLKKKQKCIITMIITLYYSSYLVLQSCSASHRNLQACARAAGVAYDTTKERRVEPSNFLRTVRRKKSYNAISFPWSDPRCSRRWQQARRKFEVGKVFRSRYGQWEEIQDHARC